ncbi:inactive tyrosine-protein kinase PRAG1 [Kryptolebias marmoratus]|uniref:Inactive tyrosine-protein kinase PEAK1 n=1 Tax=Kryptolebias marmoratus TaxID=37003 RepID=A0A3Q3G9K3_KRYMA|nr:inactive tyrosine-protein kinase PRAG1 [Kryptolebias marmoratus]XP_017263360.1 inactive tyrosine-protein kinase PRAG1 [Kryptolebias marmoratus]XP_037835354.1 inactive tyrosine-protein kinase PRAG1 [Kryptolebias marmoratus]
MSACSDFAEHVWKPGSCKNCFHPLSAHKTVGVPDGSVQAACLKSNLGGDEEAGLTALSPYSKPTIAVRPTMMSLDTSEPKDINMNIEQQDNAKSPAERMGLKKLLNMSQLYIDNNGCNKAQRNAVLQSPEAKTDYNNCLSLSPLSLSPSLLPKDSMIISNILVSQEEGRGSQNFKKNANEDSCWQHNNMAANRNKGTHNGSGVTNLKESCGTTEEVSLSVDIVPSDHATIHCNSVSSNHVIKTTSSSSTLSHMSASNVDITSQCSPTSLNSVPVLSKENSLSDSPSSYRSSTDSLSGPDGLVGRPVSQSPQSPPAIGSLGSTSSSPLVRANSEPIYAESTKKKSKPGNGIQTHPESPNQTKQSQCSEFEQSGESQRATITVMAAHTEENNRTFYLSSPDSGVSTQCNFSPTACKNPSSPAFRWPSPSRSAPCLSREASLSPNLYPKPQSSPPIPPKRSSRSPKLGTSSLSPSLSSPVPLPEFPKLGASSLSTATPSSVLLPELPVFFLVSSREGQLNVPTDNQSASSEHSQKPHHHSSGWNCCIEEEEEEDEKERKGVKKKKLAASPGTTSMVTGLVNGAGVWKEASDCNARNSPHLMTQPGTAPPAGLNNGACQGETKGTGAEESKHNESMPAKQTLHAGSSELLAAGKGVAKNDPNPPPPPPKKLHRGSSKMSGSSVELNCCSQQGSVESHTSSLRSLGSTSLPTASTDNLAADSGSRDATRMSCSSPFPRTPVASAPGSPLPPSFNSLGNQPPPLPEKKMVNRTVSAPDSANGKPFVRAYPRLPFAGSESNVCRSVEASSRASLPPSPVDPRPVFSSNESLERCPTPLGRPSRSRTLDEPLKTTQGRLGVHCRTSITVSSSPQLSAPFSASEPGSTPNLGSSLQLQTLLSNIDSREGVYSKLGGLYAESLRRLALKCEDHFTCSQKNPFRFDESNWSLFRLTSNKPSCNAGDAVYYSAACALDPSNSYAVKICKSPSIEAKQGHLYGLSVQQSIPPHFNLQQDCGHFLACVPQSMLPSDEASLPSASSASVPQADQERVVVITPEIPHQTATDFVREWEVVHKTQPEVYERRVCFLLLQLCNGLEHLKEHGVTHRDLCLENLLLVPHQRRHQQAESTACNGAAAGDAQRHLPRLLISNFAKAKRRSSEDAASTSGDPRVKRDHARLAPEIVSAAQYRKFDEFQTGILIYELLHQPNPFEVSPALREQDYRSEDLPPVPSVSLYSSGLQKLAQLLLQPDPIKRIHIQEAKRILQSLLWGPRRDLMEQQWERHRKGAGLVDSSRNESLLNWLDVKRALLMMKFAERSLEPERNAELEDWLCCQYFSSAHPLSLCHTAELLYSLK